MPAIKTLKSGGYVVRLKLPKDVREDYKLSHGQAVEATLYMPKGTSPARAQQEGAEFIAETRKRIAAIRAAHTGTGVDLSTVEARKLAGELYLWVQERTQPDEWEDIAQQILEAMQEAAGPLLKHEDPQVLWRDNIGGVRTALLPILEEIARLPSFLSMKGLVLTNTARAKLTEYLYEDLQSALRTQARIAKGDHSPDTYLRKFGSGATVIGPDKGLKPMELLELWAKKREPAASTIENYRSYFRLLQKEFPERSVSSIEPQEARQFVDALIAGKRTARTVQRNWLKAYRHVCAWGLENKHLRRNPFADVKVDAKKRKRHRETNAFHAEEALTILQAASAMPDIPAEGAKQDDAAKRWVPWICAYTGARAGEVCQLRGRDVFLQDGIWAIRLTPEAGSIKTGEARVVPIHEHLVTQGFLEFVKTKGKGPLFYRPRAKSEDALLSPLNVKKAPASQLRQKLAAWVRELGVSDKELQPNHAWRHTFKAKADRHGILEKIHDKMTGHSSPSEGRKYGIPTLEDMAEALKKFPRWEID